MQTDGKGWLFAPLGRRRRPDAHALRAGRVAGANPLYPSRTTRPAQARPPGQPDQPELSDVFPFVFTTYRLTEHHTAGGMSRTLPYLTELQPEMFCEVSPRLARERGLENLGWATIVTARTAIEARVLVTDRVRPLRVGDRSSTRSGCPTTGAERHHHRRRPTTWST